MGLLSSDLVFPLGIMAYTLFFSAYKAVGRILAPQKWSFFHGHYSQRIYLGFLVLAARFVVVFCFQVSSIAVFGLCWISLFLFSVGFSVMGSCVLGEDYESFIPR